MDIVEDVIEFNREVLGIAAGLIPCIPHEDTYRLTELQMYEEAGEFREACNVGDITGAVDALVDEIYFSIGGLYKIGLDADQIREAFAVVHKANMAKAAGKKKGREGFNAADAIKPDGWIPPEEELGNIIYGDLL